MGRYVHHVRGFAVTVEQVSCDWCGMLSTESFTGPEGNPLPIPRGWNRYFIGGIARDCCPKCSDGKPREMIAAKEGGKA